MPRFSKPQQLGGMNSAPVRPGAHINGNASFPASNVSGCKAKSNCVSRKPGVGSSWRRTCQAIGNELLTEASCCDESSGDRRSPESPSAEGDILKQRRDNIE
jgi:hypothetical protein